MSSGSKLLRAEAVAGRAGAVRVVEREHARRDLGKRDAAGGAGELLREDASSPSSTSTCDHAVGQPQAPSRSSRSAAGPPSLTHQAVDEDLDGVLLFLSSSMSSASSTSSPSTRTRTKPSWRRSSQLLAELALTAAHDGREHQKRVPSGSAGPGRPSAGWSGPRSRCRTRAVRPADARVQQPQVVVDLGDGADGGARVVGRSTSARSRSPARGPRSSRRPASPSARGTGARRPRATRRSGAGPRRRWCRRRARTCPTRTGR